MTNWRLPEWPWSGWWWWWELSGGGAGNNEEDNVIMTAPNKKNINRVGDKVTHAGYKTERAHKYIRHHFETMFYYEGLPKL
jgi:hypothetical protein